MNKNVPKTPFATRLSGSAKETELRLRSIFQWKKKRPPVILLALAVLVALLCGGLVSCESERAGAANSQEQETGTAADAAPSVSPEGEEEWEVAPLEGEAVSPDGMVQVRLVGRVDGVTAGGLAAPESVQVREVETGKVLWETRGGYTHAVSWSPEEKYLTLARTDRSRCTVTVVDLDSWTSWDVTLPDGSPIPEYTFLPDDEPWIQWSDAYGYGFYLTLGRGGDGGERDTYRVYLQSGAQIKGHTDNVEKELLPGEYNLNHDGTPEQLCRLTLGDLAAGVVTYVELQVKDADGALLWADRANTSHAGWNSLFVCTLEGEDYLLRYNPIMYQGYCDYTYRLFHLGPDRGEVVRQENSISFDINGAYSMGGAHRFDPYAIAAFMEEVNGLLAQSKLLINTDLALESMDPQAPRDDLYWLTRENAYPGYVYDEHKSMLENLLALEWAFQQDAA